MCEISRGLKGNAAVGAADIGIGVLGVVTEGMSIEIDVSSGGIAALGAGIVGTGIEIGGVGIEVEVGTGESEGFEG